MTEAEALGWCAAHQAVTRWFERDGVGSLRVTVQIADEPVTAIVPVAGREPALVLTVAVAELTEEVECLRRRLALRAV